jgi:periplasmic protein TonB
MKTEGVVLPQTTWDDIVFESRNKEYGAYINRKNYSKYIFIALGITVVVLLLVLVAPALAELIRSARGPEEPKLKEMTVSLDQPPPITPQPPPPDVRIPPPVKTIIKFLPPKVTEKEVVEEEEMPTIEEIKENETGAVAQEGTGEVVFDEPVVEAPAGDDEDKVFLAVEQAAEFPGGVAAMMKFLQKNIKYPASAKRMGIEGRVFVKFIVDKEGGISNMEIVKGINADLDKEAMRVIKLMPPWKPGKQNGRAVKSQFVLPVYFKLDS